MATTSIYQIELTDRGARRTPTFDRALEAIDGLLNNLQTPSGGSQSWGDKAGGAYFQSTQGGNIALIGGDLDVTGQSLVGFNGADIQVNHTTASIPGGGSNDEKVSLSGWFNDGTLKYMAIRRTAGTGTQVLVEMYANASDLATLTNGKQIIGQFGSGINVDANWTKGPLFGGGSSDLFIPLNYEDEDGGSQLHFRVLNQDGSNAGTYELRFVGEPSSISLV